MRNEVFLDTAYAIALAAPSDQLHAQAFALAGQLVVNKTRLVTTQAVLLEIGNALSKQRYRSAAVQLLSSLEDDHLVEVMGLTPELYAAGFAPYQARPDKEWG